MTKYLLLLFILIPYLSHAEDDKFVVDGGIGIFSSAINQPSETKMASVSLQEDIWRPIKDRFTAGLWLDNYGNGHSNSGFFSTQLGYEVERNGLLAGIFFGPSVVNQKDVLLGSNFEFTVDLHLGLQDIQGNYFGILYRHLSDAGMTSINIGRDFIGLEFRY